MPAPLTMTATRCLVAAGFGVVLATAGAAEPPVTDRALHTHDELERYWNESLSGGPGKDGIPSIDRPRFLSADEADGWLDDGDRVIGLHHGGEARAYPQSVLVWHEIVNDEVGGEAFAITYCPLTGTGVGYHRGDTELGVSGRLVNSNLLMYDRATDSHWPQILSTAVEGERKGESLVEKRVIWTTWGRWKERHPETTVLSRRTGHARNYRRDPYGGYNPRKGYYASDETLFALMHDSDRYAPKDVVFGFRTRQGAFAVDREALAEHGILRHASGGEHFLVVHDPGLDTAWVYRSDSAPEIEENLADTIEFDASGPRHESLDGLEPVNGFEAMWFAWYAFYPDTEIIDGPGD